MSQPLWTPGEWKAEGRRVVVEAHPESSRETITIVGAMLYIEEKPDHEFSGLYGNRKQARANAQLCAMSPRLYSVLESLVTRLMNDTWTEGDVADALEVMADARGEAP